MGSVTVGEKKSAIISILFLNICVKNVLKTADECGS